MPQIRQLEPHVADLIAAGEVVERPASVVKELLENAIDAQASAITVEIQNGGMAYIRVADNGCGIAAEDLPTAFLRHATSKLRTAEDLGAIGTLGFRGEALAAISAVSRMDVFTRRQGEEAGATLSLEGGIPGVCGAAGCPEGTTMVVRNLFYNTPARLKFMKKDSAEASAITGVVQHLALSNPHISFKLIKDGAEVLHTPGDNQLLSAIYAALGREFALGLTEVEGSGDGAALRGYITKPLCGRGTRGMQIFFVNGRFIRSPLLTAAVEEAYKNQMMKGKFPGCVLHLDLPREQVDVNVHPAKTVVKFANERQVFAAVYHVVQDALDRGGKPAAPQTPVSHPAAQPDIRQPQPRQDFYRRMDAETFRTQYEPPKEKKAVAAAPATAFVSRIPPADTELRGRVAVHDVVQPTTSALAEEREKEEEGRRFLSVSPAKTFDPVIQRDQRVAVPVSGVEPPAPAPAEEENVPLEPVQTSFLEERPAPWRLMGEVLRTYIIAEDGVDVWLIDKHAAHERINFDRLKARTEPVMGQQLLAPEAVKLAAEDYAVLLEQLPLLEEFGFEAEDFGGETILVRTAPSEIDVGQVGETLELLAEKLRLAGTADPAAARDAMLHTMACKAAIKGGWVSNSAELNVLVEKVQSGEIRYCPHGRPVAVKLSRYELEKMFRRA